MDSGPIFIAGLSFSGKTPLRLMLSSHPNIAMTRRTYMWPRYYGRYSDLSRQDNFEHCLQAMLRHKHVQALKPDPDRIRREFWQGPPTYGRLFALFHEHNAERLGKSRWGDQLGFVERYADLVFAAYPSAKMIHMVRDPRDRYEASTPTSHHHSGGVGWDIARWLHSVRLAKRNRQRYPDRYKVVRYETLAARPEETLREICTFIGEDFVPTMLTIEDAVQFADGERDLFNGAPRHATEAGVCRSSYRILSAREIAFTQTYAKREMLLYGYPLVPMTFSLRERFRCYFVDWPVNLAGVVAWRTLEATPFAKH